MSTNNSCQTTQINCSGSKSFLIIIVLYILLAIILGSYLY